MLETDEIFEAGEPDLQGFDFALSDVGLALQMWCDLNEGSALWHHERREDRWKGWRSSIYFRVTVPVLTGTLRPLVTSLGVLRWII
jgi:hypothetical protein